MSRHPVEIQRDLTALGPDPSQRHHEAKCALEQELIDAEAEHTEKVAAYWEFRRETEADIVAYEAMCHAIKTALAPVILMMAEGLRLEAHIDDALAFLAGEAATLKLGQGPPQMNRHDWPALIGAELRRVRRAVLGERE